jgi:hypothetical protein
MSAPVSRGDYLPREQADKPKGESAGWLLWLAAAREWLKRIPKTVEAVWVEVMLIAIVVFVGGGAFVGFVMANWHIVYRIATS